MKTKTILKFIAVLVFVLGAITFVDASRKRPKIQPAESFVLTSIITRAENGEPPVVTGITVRMVATNGFYKSVLTRRMDEEYHKAVSVKFLDDTATYYLENGRLEYEHPSSADLERDRHAQSADWVTKSPVFAGKDSMLGLDVYLTHQPLSEGWVKQAFSPRTRATPLLVHEHRGNVDYVQQAIGIQFRDVPQDEVRLPNLPISFEVSKRFEAGMASNPENVEIVRRLIEDREATTEQLRVRGRIE